MHRKALLFLLASLLILPAAVSAQADYQQPKETEEQIFKAKVLEITEQQESIREDGSKAILQKIKLVGLKDEWQGKEIIVDNSDFDVISAQAYEPGDKVLVSNSRGVDGEEVYYIIDHSRSGTLYWLAGLFALAVILVGRQKGLRALAVLVLTFLIILKFIVPQILAGYNPLFISIVGSFFILILAVLITEGFKRTSAISIAAILLSLFLTGLLSVIFSALSKLSGFASEEAAYLVSLSGGTLNIKGLLLAGIIIGALGVLDDVVISQVALVKELQSANPKLPKKMIYQQAMKVGISHLSSMVNTLFLAYAGAALPLLILFSVKQPPYLNFNLVLDNELIATEIVRSLTGSIGLILAVPIATLLAVSLNKQKNN